MKYEDPSCAYCPDSVRACRIGESVERGPGYCPSKVDQDGIDAAADKYHDAETRRIARVAAEILRSRWRRIRDRAPRAW